MSISLSPYINFKDNAREAFMFYQSVFGGQLDMNTFGEFGADSDPNNQDNIMHAMLTLDNGEVITGADTPSMMEYKPTAGFSVLLNGDEPDVLRGWFEKLGEGGRVVMPLEKQIWGDEFGMVADKFAINWMVNIRGNG